MEAHLSDITRVIQLAVAPVFLLTAVATLIGALNARLGRIVDRRRVVLDRMAGKDAADLTEMQDEIGGLSARATLIYYAIFFAVIAALCVCLVVAGAFLGALLGIDLARTVAVLFVTAMFAMIVALSLLLREVFVAVNSKFHQRHRRSADPS
jgi:hypothetical protein